jgi:hypothetical protein
MRMVGKTIWSDKREVPQPAVGVSLHAIET